MFLPHLKLLLGVLSIIATDGWSSGPGSCDKPGHGTQGSGDGGYSLVVYGSAKPGEPLELELKGDSSFRGFLVTQPSATAGTYGGLDQKKMAIKACTGQLAVGHNNGVEKTTVAWRYNLPDDAVSHTITVVVVKNKNQWFKFTKMIEIAVDCEISMWSGWSETTTCPKKTSGCDSSKCTHAMRTCLTCQTFCFFIIFISPVTFSRDLGLCSARVYVTDKAPRSQGYN
jgi:hypothetical protein